MAMTPFTNPAVAQVFGAYPPPVRLQMLALRELIERDCPALEVKTAPFEAYNARLDAALSEMSWSHTGVTNWYKNSKGRVVMNSPWRLVDYRNMLATFEPAEYWFAPRA